MGGGSPGLLHLLPGLLFLMLLLHVLLLLPGSGSMLLLQGVHLALMEVPLPLRHPPRLHRHVRPPRETSSWLHRDSNSLSRCSACCCCCTRWVMSVCRGGSPGVGLPARGTFLGCPALPRLRLLPY